MSKLLPDVSLCRLVFRSNYARLQRSSFAGGGGETEADKRRVKSAFVQDRLRPNDGHCTCEKEVEKAHEVEKKRKDKSVRGRSQVGLRVQRHERGLLGVAYIFFSRTLLFLAFMREGGVKKKKNLKMDTQCMRSEMKHISSFYS